LSGETRTCITNCSLRSSAQRRQRISPVLARRDQGCGREV